MIERWWSGGVIVGIDVDVAMAGGTHANDL